MTERYEMHADTYGHIVGWSTGDGAHAIAADRERWVRAADYAQLQKLCAALYQFAGEVDAPVAVLDVLNAAQQGDAVTDEMIEAAMSHHSKPKQTSLWASPILWIFAVALFARIIQWVMQ